MPSYNRMKRLFLGGLLWLFLLPFGLMVLSLETGFLDFDNLPDTNFTCVGKVIGGYYADLETNCQMFHVCTIGQADEPMDIRFLCLNGTVFDQETRVCERIDEVDCSKSEQFYSLNLELYGNSGPILEETPEVPQETESPSITISPTTSTTTTTTTKRPTTKQTNSPYFTTIRPSSATTTANSHQNVAGHHFRVNNPDIRFNPEEINISLNPGAPPDIRTKHFDPHHIYSDSSKVLVSHNGDNDEEQSVRVQKPERVSGSSSTSPKSIYSVDVSDSEKLPQNSDDDFGFSDDFRGTELPRHQQFLIQTNSFRHSQSFPPNLNQNANQYHHPQFHSTTVKHQQPGHTTPRTLYLHTLKTPQVTQHQHFTHHPRTEKTPQRVQIPIPLLPTLPPLTFSTPAPFTLQRHIENKRYTKDHQAPPRIIISASASVSDASGRRLNYSLGTIGAAQILETPPSSYDEYKDSDVGLDPFYHDVPKVKQKKRRRRSADTKKINPFEIIKNEKEAVEVLKFLFTWYQSHQATATVPPSTSPASPDLIREINDELAPASGDSLLKTDSSEFHFTSAGEPSSSEKTTASYENSELFKKSSRFSIVGGYRNDNQKPRRKIKDRASRRISVADSHDFANAQAADKPRNEAVLKDSHGPENYRGATEGATHYVNIASSEENESAVARDDAVLKDLRDLERTRGSSEGATLNSKENEYAAGISTSKSRNNEALKDSHDLGNSPGSTEEAPHYVSIAETKNSSRNDAVIKEKMDNADVTILKDAKERPFNPDDYVDDNYEGVVYKENGTNNERINVTTQDDADFKEDDKTRGFVDPHAVAQLYKYFNVHNQLTTLIPTRRRVMDLIEAEEDENDDILKQKSKDSARLTEINILSEVNERSNESGSSSTTSTTTAPPKYTARRRGRGRPRVVDSYQEATFTSSISKEQLDFNHHESKNYISGNGLNKRGRSRNRSRLISSYSSTTQASTTEREQEKVTAVAAESSSTLNLDQIFGTTDVPLVAAKDLDEATEGVIHSENGDNFNLEFSPNFDIETKSDGDEEVVNDNTALEKNDTMDSTQNNMENGSFASDSKDRRDKLANPAPIPKLGESDREIYSKEHKKNENNYEANVDLVEKVVKEFEEEEVGDVKKNKQTDSDLVEDDVNKYEKEKETHLRLNEGELIESDKEKETDSKDYRSDKEVNSENINEHERDDISFEEAKNENSETTTPYNTKTSENTDFSIITKTDTITVESTTEPLVIKMHNLEPISELMPMALPTDNPTYLIKLLRYYAEKAMTEEPEKSYDVLTEHFVTSTVPPTTTTGNYRNSEVRRQRQRNKHRHYPRDSTTDYLPTLRDIYENTRPFSVDINADYNEREADANANANNFTTNNEKSVDNSNSPNQIDSETTPLHNASSSEELKENLLEKLTLIEQTLANSSTALPETNSGISDTTVTTPLVSFEDKESFATTFSAITEPTKPVESSTLSQELTRMFEINMEATTTPATLKHENADRNYDSFYDDLFVVPELTERSSGYEGNDYDLKKEGQSHTRPENIRESHEHANTDKSDVDTTTYKEQDPTSQFPTTVNEGVTDAQKNIIELHVTEVTTALPDVEIQKSISIPISVLENNFDVPNDVSHAQDINGLVSSERGDDDSEKLSTVPGFSSTPSLTHVHEYETTQKEMTGNTVTETVPFTTVTTTEENRHQETSTLNYIEETIIPVVQENATEIIFVKNKDANEEVKNDSSVLPPNIHMDMPRTLNSSHLLQVSVETTSEPITTTISTTTTSTPLFIRKTRPTRRRPYKSQRNQFGRHRFSTELYTKKPSTIEDHKRKNITDPPLHRSVSPTRSELRKVSLHTTPLSSKHQRRTPTKVGKHYVFNCFGKDTNKFYADPRDCRLFHYCTQGYSKNQLLDLKYVCDQKTFFDEETLICTKVKPSRCL